MLIYSITEISESFGAKEDYPWVIVQHDMNDVPERLIAHCFHREDAERIKLALELMQSVPPKVRDGKFRQTILDKIAATPGWQWPKSAVKGKDA